jgi:hypothetical protein
LKENHSDAEKEVPKNISSPKGRMVRITIYIHVDDDYDFVIERSFCDHCNAEWHSSLIN